MLVEAFRMGFPIVCGIAGAFPRRVFGEASDGLCCAWGGATKVVEDHHLLLSYAWCGWRRHSALLLAWTQPSPVVWLNVPWDGSPLSLLATDGHV